MKKVLGYIIIISGILFLFLTIPLLVQLLSSFNLNMDTYLETLKLIGICLIPSSIYTIIILITIKKGIDLIN